MKTVCALALFILLAAIDNTFAAGQSMAMKQDLAEAQAKKNQKKAQIKYLKGNLFRELSVHSRAVKYYCDALRLNPKHEGAARAIADMKCSCALQEPK